MEKSNISQHIGQRIKVRRKELKISQKELAQKCGYRHASSITMLEKGGRDISILKIELIAAALYITPRQLIQYDSADTTQPSYNLTTWELRLLSKASMLNNSGKNIIMQTAVDTSSLPKYTKNNNNNTE